MKLSTMVADTVVAMSILLMACARRANRHCWQAQPIFESGIIFVTAYHGQLGDPVHALSLVGSDRLLTGQGELAGGATALAATCRSRRIFAICCWRHCAISPAQPDSWHHLRLCCLAAGFVALFAGGTLPALIHTVSTTIGHGPRISSYA